MTRTLIEVPLDHVLDHPLNAHVVSERDRRKIANNIRRTGRYPPLIVRALTPESEYYPGEEGYYQILDGHQRRLIFVDLVEEGYDQFANGHENLAHLEDAAALTEQWAHQVDILYLDPPYPGVTGYETYHVLDSVFAGRLVPTQRSVWSTARFSLQLLDLLGKAQEIPLWVISYGSVGTTLKEILGLVAAYRPAQAVVVEYAHLQAIARTEVAEANREFIILARGEKHA